MNVLVGQFLIADGMDIRTGINTILNWGTGIAAVYVAPGVINGFKTMHEDDRGKQKILSGLAVQLAPQLVRLSFNTFAPGSTDFGDGSTFR
jgi:hypothetical protein